MKTIQMERGADGVLKIYVYEEINEFWGIGAKAFSRQLHEAGEVSRIDLHINSIGGDVFDAAAMMNELKAHPARVEVYVDGLAASAASVLAMAGDRIVMGEGAFLMIHDPWTVAWGAAEALEKAAEMLKKVKDEIAKIYAQRSGQAEAWALEKMSEETWFGPEEAVAAGLADEALGEGLASETMRVDNSRRTRVAARWRNAPAGVMDRLIQPEPEPEVVENTENRKRKLKLLELGVRGAG